MLYIYSQGVTFKISKLDDARTLKYYLIIYYIFM